MLKNLKTAVSVLSDNNAVNAFSVVFLFSAILYRIALAIAIAAAEAPPFGVTKGAQVFARTLMGVGHDFFVLVIYLLLALIAYTVFAAMRRTPPGRWSLVAGSVALFGLIFWNTMISGSHFNLLFTMNMGFTWGIFMEFFTILNLKDFLLLMTWRDYFAVAFCVGLFLVLFRKRVRLLTPRRVLGILAVAVFFIVAGSISPSVKMPDEIVLNPHEFFVRDALRSMVASRRETPEKSTAGNKVYLAEAPFISGSLPRAGSPAHARVEANIVIVILESTATEYIFDTVKYAGGKMPMPYLHSLTAKSLHFTQHFASNNSSPRSIFSIFSGLYESPETRFFSMERKLKIPHMVDFAGKNYEHFLVTPADLNWYFPKAWFQNRGFKRLYDYNALKQIPEYKAGPTAVRDEFKTAEHFLDLVKQTTKPFVGIYYTFVGHWPYPDLAAEHKIIQADSSRSRYINNLYAQDQVIQQIVSGFELSGRAENTIFVFVGDHGEAFYQHPGNRVHSGESYNENIASPLIIYSPRLIKPGRIEYPTVHADILPTLLDAMGAPFDARQFQGESALRGNPARNYVFTYGNENTLTAVSKDLQKVSLLRTQKNCRSFDLRRDPAETQNRGCSTGNEQYRALEAFYRVQPGMLKGYNELCNKQGC
ncbi:MAG: sulfatase-like hydrolase/transferase [Turneriella sp.]